MNEGEIEQISKMNGRKIALTWYSARTHVVSVD